MCVRVCGCVMQGYHSDVVIVVSKTAPEKGAHGISLFLVEAGTDGCAGMCVWGGGARTGVFVRQTVMVAVVPPRLPLNPTVMIV